MTDDFQLFANPDEVQSGIDADTALITAYLARELTLVQIVAVEERLATDPAFRAHAAPIIKAWTLPRSFGGIAEKDRVSSAAITPAARKKPRSILTTQLLRVAAIVAVFVLPIAGLAQTVSYVAAHPNVPGHNIAKRIVAPFHPAPPQQRGPAVRRLGPALLTSPHIAGEAGQARVLKDGRVLVNDIVRREIFVLDSSLTNPVTLFDSNNAGRVRYGRTRLSTTLRSFFPTFFGFRGDTILFLSYTSNTAGMGHDLAVLDEQLRLARVDTTFPVLVWSIAMQIQDGAERWSSSLGILSPFHRPQGVGCGSHASLEADCAGLIVSYIPETKVSDTLTVLYGPAYTGGFGATSDHWTVVSDGSIAILRAREYRIEWINSDRTRTLGPRIPYEWRRLDLRTRTRMADSVNAERRQIYETNLRLWQLDSADVANGRPWNPRLPFTAIPGVRGVGVAQTPVDTTGGRGRGGGQGAAAIIGSTGAPGAPARPFVPRVLGDETITDGQRRLNRPRLTLISGPEEYPDSLPPVDRNVNAILPDLDNRLWIRTRAWETPPGAPTRYDIINRAGELLDRIDVPSDRKVIGFGAGGVVILLAQSGGIYTLEKVRY